MSEVGRIYRYHRVGYDEREIELCPDGVIGTGAGGAERRWQLLGTDPQQLSIFGDHGEICRLKLGADGSWRGAWLQFERMPVVRIVSGKLNSFCL